MLKKRTIELLTYFIKVIVIYAVLFIITSNLSSRAHIEPLNDIIDLIFVRTGLMACLMGEESAFCLDRERLETFTASILLTISLVLPTLNMAFFRRLKVTFIAISVFLSACLLDVFFQEKQQHLLQLYRAGYLSKLGVSYYVYNWGDRIIVNINYYLFPFLFWFLFCYKNFRQASGTSRSRIS